MIYIYAFLAIILFKTLLNIFRYFNNEYLYKKWLEYFEKLLKEEECAEYISYTHAIQQNFKNANVSEPCVPEMEPMGWGYAARVTIKAFDNIFTNNKRNVQYVNNAFLEAKGIYRTRIFEAFNPWYWIKLVLFLPKNIISYLGLETNNIYTRIFQLLFWIIDSILVVVFKDEIATFIKGILK